MILNDVSAARSTSKVILAGGNIVNHARLLNRKED